MLRHVPWSSSRKIIKNQQPPIYHHLKLTQLYSLHYIPMSTPQSLLFVIVGRNEPLYEAEFSKHGSSTSDAVRRQNCFVLHSALDLVERAAWTTNNMYLKVVDKLNSQHVSCFLSAGNMKLMILHRGTNEDNIRNFFQDVYELYVKFSMNPFYRYDTPIKSEAFDTRVRALARSLSSGTRLLHASAIPTQAIKHVVVFRFQPEACSEQIHAIQKSLLELPIQISGIRKYELGVDRELPAGQNYPLGKNRTLTWSATFDSIQDYQSYDTYRSVYGVSGESSDLWWTRLRERLFSITLKTKIPELLIRLADQRV